MKNADHDTLKYLLPLLLFAALLSCKKTKTLFRPVSAAESGIGFVNRVKEDSLFNVFEYMNIYTGAGVAAGDINNDGLTDLYFSANTGGGKLYLNKGNLKFEDISKQAGLIPSRWETGVTMADVNQDGWLDIYVNVSGSEKFGDPANLLYINQKNGAFREEAAKYGIAERRLTMHAGFFDYDRDGDLDLFLITNPADEMVTGINIVTDRKLNGESAGTDILYRNNGDGTFTDVSREAGILVEGYSLGAGFSDVNMDGWPDIYVSNDFLSNDILYINNGNGTFSDKTSECLKHTSFAAMGNDIADFNNDGMPDIYVLDMLPEDNYRRKMIMPASSYDKFKLSVARGYTAQYSRNTLQLNNGNGTFSEIAFMSGVSSTDWSWSALWADYDNDGDKDLMVTNGFYRDLGNLDYIHYQAKLNNPMGRQDARREARLKAITELPQIPLHDYLFENNDDLTFTKRSDEWGFDEAGFSNGACYADLDNDGDLDLVINRFNSEAKLFENTSDKRNNGFLRIKLKGDRRNIQGVGAKIFLYTGDNLQFQEFYPSRGYESSMEPVIHFGTGKIKTADSLMIVWPDGKKEIRKEVRLDTLIEIAYTDATDAPGASVQTLETLHETSGALGIEKIHVENEFVDFKIQPLLPHMHSQNGPGIAVADINHDGREDFYTGSASGSLKSVYLQTTNGSFEKHTLDGHKDAEDMGVLFFDADGDTDEDLYVVSGGSENKQGSEAQQDRLYLNDGSGKLHYSPTAIPDTRASGSCVVSADYDRDGDLDLFVGGRVVPGMYPSAPQSYLLRNDSRAGRCVFTSVADKDLATAGMVTSALWTDVDNDGWMDLMLAGEFMPITIFKNNSGKLLRTGAGSGLDDTEGWWNSLAAADMDNDGDIDYFAGNLGLNSRHKASVKEPLCIYAKDFDRNGLIDPVMCYYLEGKNYLYPTRDEMIRQINPMRGRFKTYASYASVTFEESFTKDELRDATLLKSKTFQTAYIENLGNGKFRVKPMPLPAQSAPVFCILTEDFNGDGNTDVLLAGNSYATEASTGRYDAMRALLFAGDGKGNFREDRKTLPGLKADKDVKGMVQLYMARGNQLMLVANNNDRMEAYERRSTGERTIDPGAGAAWVQIRTKSGKTFRHECYYGNNYLSHTSRRIRLPADVESVTITDFRGNKRHEKY